MHHLEALLMYQRLPRDEQGCVLDGALRGDSMKRIRQRNPCPAELPKGARMDSMWTPLVIVGVLIAMVVILKLGGVV